MEEILSLYAVVGDDVVLFEQRLAEEYKSTILRMGVKISLSKSIIPQMFEGEVRGGVDFLCK